jgi:hypothetical protein
MGIAIAQATLQSLVDQHNGVSYKEAIEEIRDYITKVQKNLSNIDILQCSCHVSPTNYENMITLSVDVDCPHHGKWYKHDTHI